MINETESADNKPLIKSPDLFPVVGVGASAGAPDAFSKFVKAIPENSGMAYVLVEDLPPGSTGRLVQMLPEIAGIPVLQFTDGMEVSPDHIYIIPGDKMLIANDGRLELNPRVSVKNKPDFPVNLFFASLAEIHQSHAVGVVLAGPGTDGTAGLTMIKENGGITFAENSATADHNSMPGSAIRAGVVDFVLSPEQIPKKILELTKITTRPHQSESSLRSDEEAIKQMLFLLRLRRGTDFTYYKRNIIRRRILRRMAFNKSEGYDAYLHFLEEHAEEQDHLYNDFLIPVTDFFRDSKIFAHLCSTLFPGIIKNKSGSVAVRIWIAGCSTGQEAYSVAICLKEFLGTRSEEVRIFATDISERAIAKARAGIYSESDVEAVSRHQLQEFFTKEAGGFRVNKEIRDMCVFAVHDFLKDPPFIKIDFISCRNVLIYMEPYLQKKALAVFHYALIPAGFLLMGKSETAGTEPALFSASVKSDKLFSRRDGPGRFMQPVTARAEKSHAGPGNLHSEITRTDFKKTADDIMLDRFMPAGVIIDAEGNILHFRGKTNDYLEQPAGRPTSDIFKMARRGLSFELRSLVHKISKTNAPLKKENISVEINGDTRLVTVEAIPLQNIIEPYYLLLFHAVDKHAAGQFFRGKTKAAKADDKDRHIEQLERELTYLREDIRLITDSQAAANEELQSGNEELQSGSEELQSLNAELEAGKKELQSINEELLAVNREITSLNDRIIAARTYAEAIVENIREPLVVLDSGLRVQTANSAFYSIFRVTAQETEGFHIYELGNGQWNIPALRALLESIIPLHAKFNDFEVRHVFLSIGERVMMLNGREIIRSSAENLILLSIEDITDKINARKNIEDSERRYNKMVMQSPFAFAVLKGKDMVVTLANDSIKEMWGKVPGVEGKPILEVLPEIRNQPFPALLHEVYHTGIPFYAYEFPAKIIRSGKEITGYFNMIYQPYREADDTISGVAIIAVEVTTQAELNKKIKESEAHFRLMSELMPAKISNTAPGGEVTYFNQQWLEYSGKTFEELKDFGYLQMMHPDELEEFQTRREKAAADGTALEMEMRFRDNEGKYRWHLNIAAPVKDDAGNIDMWIWVTTEIQQQKEQHEALEKAVSHRTADLLKANESLHQKNDELYKMNEDLEEFTYVSSHDLQEPLRKIRTAAGRLLTNEYAQLSDEGQGMLKRMQASAEKMQTLIHNLLTYARLGTAQRRPEKIKINDIIQNVLKELEETIAEKQATVQVHEGCELHIIPFQFHQLLYNLVSNALKFARVGVPPQILISGRHVTAAAAENTSLDPAKEYCHITVSDNGIGFENKFREKVFEVFQKLHGNEEYAGTGIGLAIVKKIVSNHNGFITATGNLHEGATFDIYLPVS